ncbi:MAG: hypothetical protein M5U27_05105 [Gaiella sp.]|nr:hypothetical protein [Gaiella sp.]
MSGHPVERAVVYQPPFAVDGSGHLPHPGFAERLDELVASGRRGAAASWFMREGMVRRARSRGRATMSR